MGFGLLLGVVILMNSNVAIEKSVTSWHQFPVYMCNPLERETIMMQALLSNYRFSWRFHIWHIQKKESTFQLQISTLHWLLRWCAVLPPVLDTWLIWRQAAAVTPGTFHACMGVVNATNSVLIVISTVTPKNSEFVGHATSLQKVQIKRLISSSALIRILHTK